MGQKKGRKTPGDLVQSAHGGPISLCFLRPPSLVIFGSCLDWSVPSMGFYTSAELGVVQGPRGDIWSRWDPRSREHVGCTGVTLRSVGLGCMRPLPENIKLGGGSGAKQTFPSVSKEHKLGPSSAERLNIRKLLPCDPEDRGVLIHKQNCPLSRESNT